MVAAKYWTNTYPKDAEIITLPTRLSKLEKKYFLETDQLGGVNVTYNRNNTNNNRRNPNKIYVEEINNIESWRVNKSKDEITRDDQDLYWCPKHKMEGKFDGMYMNHPTNKYY